MSRDPLVFLDDILEAASRIAAYLADVDSNAFVADSMVQDAVLRNLEVIGEAAKQLTPALRTSMPEVEWRKMAGMRDVLIHEYFGIDLAVVWDAAKTKVPALAEAVQRYLDETEQA